MTKTRQTVLFIAKKQNPLCHFAHVVIPGRCETHKRVKQRNYKNCAKNFFAVENKFTGTVECLFFLSLFNTKAHNRNVSNTTHLETQIRPRTGETRSPNYGIKPWYLQCTSIHTRFVWASSSTKHTRKCNLSKFFYKFVKILFLRVINQNSTEIVPYQIFCEMRKGIKATVEIVSYNLNF